MQQGETVTLNILSLNPAVDTFRGNNLFILSMRSFKLIKRQVA